LGQAGALDPKLALTQYGHTAWRVQDGYFSGPQQAIAQTKDGQLWVGGDGGLVRFDGVHFVPWKPPQGSSLPSNLIFALLASRDGALWIGTASGLARWKDGSLTVYTNLGRFAALLEDRSGTIWAGHTRALALLPGLCRFANGEFKCFPVPAGSPLYYVGSLHQDRHGDLWVGGEAAICRWREPDPECFNIPAQPGKQEKFGVYSMGEDSNGDLWVDGGLTGVWRFTSGRWKRFNESSDLKMQSEAMLPDKGDGLWIGDVHNGLFRRLNGKTERFTRSDGLSSDTVLSIFEDREGNMWVATSSGLDRFRDVKVATLTLREGLPIDKVAAVAASHDGGIWLSGRGEIIHIRQGVVTSYRAERSLPGENFSSLLVDSRGRLWAGIGPGIVRLEHARFRGVPMPKPCTSGGVVRDLVEDVDASILVATTIPDCALFRIQGDQVQEVFTRKQIAKEEGLQVRGMAADPAGGVWLGLTLNMAHYRSGRLDWLAEKLPAQVNSMFADNEGLWAATDLGLAVYRNGKLNTLNSKNGLPCDTIEVAIKDDGGALWLKASCGLIQLPAPELASWLRDPARRVQVRMLDASDGAQSGQPTFSPAATKTQDGRLWFAIDSGGLQVVDPEHVSHNSVPPPVQVVRIVADRKAYESDQQLRLPARTRDLEIDYTAFSYAVPEKVRFRYRLEGDSPNWQDVGARREAYFSNLKPGRYRFQVAATNNDGVPSAEGASLEFIIPPAFYQTAWFRLLCIALAGCLAWLSYRWHVHNLTARLDMQFRERLSERTRIAQELHDTLLQGVLSASMQLHVANDQLTKGSPAKPLVERVLELMTQVVEEGRSALLGLRLSKGTQDLDLAFSRVPQELAVKGTAELRVGTEGLPRPLRPPIQDEVYRIGREAVVNAVRHSGATQIEVALEYGAHELRVLVRDNGCGIDSEVLRSGREGHFGLLGMRERAEKIGAKLKVLSAASGGTEVDLRVPGRIAFDSQPAGTLSKLFSRIYPRKTDPPAEGEYNKVGKR